MSLEDSFIVKYKKDRNLEDSFLIKYKKNTNVWTEIGEGSSGVVYNADNGNVIKKSDYIGGLREINFLSRINHKGVIKLIDYFINDSVYLILPKGERVLDYLQKYPNNKLKIISQILDTVLFLFKNDIIHSDLKPDNIIVIDHYPVLIDFGLTHHALDFNDSKIIDGFCGSQFYLSPFYPYYKKPASAEFFSLYKTLKDIWYLSSNPTYNKHSSTGNDDLDILFKTLSKKDVKLEEIEACNLAKSRERINGIIKKREWENINVDISKELKILKDIIGSNDETEIEVYFLAVHNIRQTIKEFTGNIYSFITAHFILSCVVFDQVYKDINEFVFKDEIAFIMKKLNGIYYTPTIWNNLTSNENMKEAIEIINRDNYSPEFDKELSHTIIDYKTKFISTYPFLDKDKIEETDFENPSFDISGYESLDDYFTLPRYYCSNLSDNIKNNIKKALVIKPYKYVYDILDL